MYRVQSRKKRWIDPVRQAELQERDRIRQAYYARLEKEKQGLLEEELELETEEEEAKEVTEPTYYTKLAKRGWYNVIGPEGEPINATLLRLDKAEAKAERMNNGADR